MDVGMVLENGPFVLQKNKITFKLNEYAWNKKANLLYLESPGGVINLPYRWALAKASLTTPTPTRKWHKITTTRSWNFTKSSPISKTMGSSLQEKVMQGSIFPTWPG